MIVTSYELKAARLGGLFLACYARTVRTFVILNRTVDLYARQIGEFAALI
jgi:hypothetical protein